MGETKMGLQKRHKSIATVALVALILGCSSRSKDPSRSEAGRLNCQRQIRSAAYSVFQYRSDHDEQFPKTLEESVTAEAGKEMAQLLTRCPAKGAAVYIYVDWSRWFTNSPVPKEYPLIYEKTKRHGDGINIALMNGSAFWDENARWITDFAKKHPEYGLEIPR